MTLIDEYHRSYRRDVGDTLINAYYILRDDMIAYYVNDLAQHLSVRQPNGSWEVCPPLRSYVLSLTSSQEAEGTLHCLMAVQEAVPIEPNPDLSRLFSAEILDRLPTSGGGRIRRTMIALIGKSKTRFTGSHFCSSLYCRQLCVMVYDSTHNTSRLNSPFPSTERLDICGFRFDRTKSMFMGRNFTTRSL